MVRRLITLFFLLTSAACFAESIASTPITTQDTNSVNSDYLLGSGDIISISVWDEPDLSFETALSDSGTIEFPFIGKVKAIGLSVTELKTAIVKSLQPNYLLNPDVNIRVTKYRRFFIRGEINSPGGYEFTPGLTLRKAVALAGGLTPRANESKMFIISDSTGDQAEKKVGLETIIKPGDIINIKQRFF